MAKIILSIKLNNGLFGKLETSSITTEQRKEEKVNWNRPLQWPHCLNHLVEMKATGQRKANMWPVNIM